MTTSQYEFFYEELVKRFFGFVQVLPIGFLEPLGSLMNEGLLRKVNSLDYYLKHRSEVTAFWRYVFVISVTFLIKVANVIVNKKIFIT